MPDTVEATTAAVLPKACDAKELTAPLLPELAVLIRRSQMW